MNWTTELPTAAGTYHWRKSHKWEAIVREVVERNGTLVSYSNRYLQYVPLSALSGEWGGPA